MLLIVHRRYPFCDFLQQQSEPEETGVIGPPCSRYPAPTERVEVLNSGA